MLHNTLSPLKRKRDAVSGELPSVGFLFSTETAIDNAMTFCVLIEQGKSELLELTTTPK